MVEQTVSDRMIDSGIKMESPNGSPLNEPLLANGNGSLASPNSGNENTFDPILESQRTFQRLLGGFNLRQAFQMNPSLFAAIQQQQLLNFNNNNNILSSPSSSRQTPDRQDDEDNYEDVENLNDGEPEDLSLGFRKEKKQSLSEGDDSGSGSANTSWSFEEQFKQLYDIKPHDEVRKAWLDDWFSFMQKINKPVTRIPIMAKQVLDLYELYHLVVKHGGLVEIINKKLWREITKGLNLPPSITSAAFTLRTQYQRYLYDYECDKMNLSTSSDLIAAIESNKREGRRNPTGGSLGGGGSVGSGNGMMNGGLHNGNGGLGPWGMPSIFGRFGSPFGMRPEDETALASLSNAQHALAAGMDPQRQLEFFQRAAAEAARNPNAMAAAAAAVASNESGRSSTDSVGNTPAPNPHKRPQPSAATSQSRPPKMPKLEKPSTTNMKLTTKDNQMYVSMEVNGTMYQGVLFAMPNVSSINGKIRSNNVNGRSASNSPSPHNFHSSITEGIDMGALSALFGADMTNFNPTSTTASE